MNNPAFHGPTYRLACAALVAAIILILAAASSVQFATGDSGWCNAQTDNCYDRLAVRLSR